MATIHAFLATIVNPAAPIIPLVIAGVVVVVWPHDVYQKCVRQYLSTNVPYDSWGIRKKVQQILIAFIVDQTHIMEMLFILTARDHNKLTRRAIKLAYSTYYQSDVMKQVHARIQAYRNLEGRDAALEMIESLI